VSHRARPHAAVEAAEALASATDPAVRAALARVVEEEASHAALAFQFVQWVMTSGARDLRASVAMDLVALVERELGLAESAPVTSDRLPAAAAPHGVLDSATRAEVRKRTLRDVVLPCALALAERHAIAGDEDVTASRDLAQLAQQQRCEASETRKCGRTGDGAVIA
jgi:hypothetical protein